ncbi:MAG: hypothetical protein RJA09_2776 [Pseudomonadota bacterium]
MPTHHRRICLIPLVLLGGLLCTPMVFAQNQVYRCDRNEYIDNAAEAQRRGCKPLDGGNLTIVQGVKPPETPAAAPAKPAAGSPAPTVNRSTSSVEQQARDRDARAILGGELRRAEQRLKDLKAEYNNGEPEKQGIEFRNHQRYLERVEKLKTDLARAESDVSSLKRELERLGPVR